MKLKKLMLTGVLVCGLIFAGCGEESETAEEKSLRNRMMKSQMKIKTILKTKMTMMLLRMKTMLKMRKKAVVNRIRVGMRIMEML